MCVCVCVCACVCVRVCVFVCVCESVCVLFNSHRRKLYDIVYNNSVQSVNLFVTRFLFANIITLPGSHVI